MTGPELYSLSAHDIELLVVLAEEAGEIVQAVAKLLRHGAHSYHPSHPEGPTNIQAIERELGDLSCVVDLLVASGLLRGHAVEIAARKKKDSLPDYLHGTLLA